VNLKIRFIAALALVASMAVGTMSGSAYHADVQEYHPIATEEFEEVWERTDRPVAETVVARTWIWGPGGFSELMSEEYAEADGGERDVQYFDKSRQEMPGNDDVDPDSPWFITQGLLATELMTGRLQLGDDTFERHLPSGRSAAGDPEDVTAPTYRAMGMHIDRAPRQTGAVIVEFIDRQGMITEDEEYADYEVMDAHFDDFTEHNIASVFWDFMNSDSTVYVDGQYVEDDLFLNPFYAVGRPMTEAYWAWVMVDGEEQDVLIQCFERRCLTFTPGNPEGWEVESGNIGQHYFAWRYREIDRDAPIVPTAGHFMFEDQTEADIETGQEIVLTAQVRTQDVRLRNVEVVFQITDGADHIDLSTDRAVTNSYGNAFVAVAGVTEGEATVRAFVDLDGSGDFTEGTDLDLGSVVVTVVEAIGPVTHEVTMTESQFVGGDLTISVGDTVVWINNSTETHTVTAADFDSGDIEPGQEFSREFTEPGEYAYVCIHHSGMEGTIIVVE
jgi:plastocyanin